MDDKDLKGFLRLNTQPDNLNNLLKLENTRFLMKKLCAFLAESPKEFDVDLATNIIMSFRKNNNKNYDHIHLVENQMTMAKRSVEEDEKKSKEEIKAYQKESIAILSIFSAVVLTFSGGLTFSSSVLENIDEVSMYRIVFIALLIGFVLLNLFYALFHYIREILGIKTQYKTMMCMNLVFTAFMALTFIAWYCGCIEHRDERIPS